MVDKKLEYFNFPIALIAGAHTDIKKVCTNIIEYVIYAHYLNLKLGTETKKIEQAYSYAKVSGQTDNRAYNNGKTLYDSLPLNLPIASVKRETVWEFLNTTKTDFDIAVFCAYCAIKSILGKKTYVRASYIYLLARMDGLKSTSDLGWIEADNYYYNTYNGRKKKDRIKDKLVQDWGLRYYAKGTRGFYISFAMPLVDLICIAERQKKKNKDARQKQTEIKALEIAIDRLKNE